MKKIKTKSFFKITITFFVFITMLYSLVLQCGSRVFETDEWGLLL